MVNLIKYELKKHFLKRSIVIALLIFSVINIVKIDSIHRENSLIGETMPPSWNDTYWQLYDDFGGQMTLDKIDALMAIQRPLEQQTADLTASTAMDNPDTYTGNVYSDYYLLTWCFVQPMEYAYMYRYTANDIVRAAQDNMQFYSEHSNEYLYRENEAIAKLFTGRSISDFAYTEMYQYYLEYDFSALLVILICLYGLIGVFVSEKEADMDTLILTTLSGGQKTVMAKIIASAIFIMIVCMWFWVLDFAAFSFSFGSLEAASLPLYALQNFEYASVNLTLSQFSLLSAGIKTMGMLVIGMIVLLISSKSKNALFPFAMSLVLCGGIILAQEMVAGSGNVLMTALNPFALVANSELFKKVEFINIFGTPILSYAAAVLFAAVTGIAITVSLITSARKSTITARK